MSRRKKGIAFCLAVSLIVIGCGSPNSGSKGERTVVANGEPLKLGYLICNSKEETVERFSAVAAYIGEKLGRKIIMYPMHTYQAQDVIKAENIHYFKTNSIVYVQLHHYIGAEVMLGEKRGPLGRFTTGKIISMKNSGIREMKDLKGKKFAFGPMFAPFGYLVQYDLMLKAGINPEEDLAYYAIPWGAYKHEKTIYGIMFSGYDLASAPTLDWDLLKNQGKIRHEDFNVIAESQKEPYCTFSHTKNADPQLTSEINKILLGVNDSTMVYMHPKRLEVISVEVSNDGKVKEDHVKWDEEGFLRTGEVLNVNKAGKIQGYEKAVDSDYDSLRAMMKNVKMDPYVEFD
ncbi:MAG: phosphate/phosphite/phosphonate ABC transporter substrate-binding protein [bacterium]